MEEYKYKFPEAGERFICPNDKKSFSTELTENELSEYLAKGSYPNVIRYHEFNFPYLQDDGYKKMEKRLQSLVNMKDCLIQSMEEDKKKLEISYESRIRKLKYAEEKLRSEIFLKNHELKTKPKPSEEPLTPD